MKKLFAILLIGTMLLSNTTANAQQTKTLIGVNNQDDEINVNNIGYSIYDRDGSLVEEGKISDLLIDDASTRAFGWTIDKELANGQSMDLYPMNNPNGFLISPNRRISLEYTLDKTAYVLTEVYNGGSLFDSNILQLNSNNLVGGV